VTSVREECVVFMQKPIVAAFVMGAIALVVALTINDGPMYMGSALLR
jgi:hypothetical protein